jgi:hypothetical protein
MRTLLRATLAFAAAMTPSMVFDNPKHGDSAPAFRAQVYPSTHTAQVLADLRP